MPPYSAIVYDMTLPGVSIGMVGRGRAKIRQGCCQSPMWQDTTVSESLPEAAARTTPALVQLLARAGADRLRADFAAQGMAGLRPVHALLLIPLLGGGRHASSLAADLGVTRQAVAQVVAKIGRASCRERV